MPSSPHDTTLPSVLAGFPAATPSLRARRGLLRRLDHKFLAPSEVVAELIAPLSSAYAVLHVPSGAIATYDSLYLDTPDLQCFHDHRRGRRLRHKIRIRNYPDRGVTFLEIKSKRSEALTEKHRLELARSDAALGDRERAFLRRHAGALADALVPTLSIHYRRVALLALDADERVTIDLDLAAALPGGPRHPFGRLAVIEVKCAPGTSRSPVMATLAAAGLRDQSFSKYCAAVARLYPDVRHNRLLPTLRAAERISR